MLTYCTLLFASISIEANNKSIAKGKEQFNLSSQCEFKESACA